MKALASQVSPEPLIAGVKWKRGTFRRRPGYF